MMKRLLVATAFAIAASSVGAIEISEAMLNGYATICAQVQTKVFARDVEFCADMTPKWRQETGSLLATRMSLTSLNTPGVSPEDIELVKAIVNQVVLPRMEGIEVYKVDNFIGKQISDLKVLPGKLDLSL